MDGNFVPLYCQDFEEAVQKWHDAVSLWQNDHFMTEPQASYYWEEIGMPPVRKHYIPFKTEELTCYQIYDDRAAAYP